MRQRSPGKRPLCQKQASTVSCKAEETQGFQPSEKLSCHNWLGDREWVVTHSLVFILIGVGLHLDWSLVLAWSISHQYFSQKDFSHQDHPLSVTVKKIA